MRWGAKVVRGILVGCKANATRRALNFLLVSYFRPDKQFVWSVQIRTRPLSCNFVFGPARMRGARAFIFCLNDIHLQR